MTEVELGFIYTELYTKAVIIYMQKGHVFRDASFISILMALLLFLFTTSKRNYVKTDIFITYILLGGALTIEIYAFYMILFSDLTMVQLLRLKWIQLWGFIHNTYVYFHRITAARWSNTMGQYNMINYCVGEQADTLINRIMHPVKVKGILDRRRYSSYPIVHEELKDFIFS